MVDFHTRDTMIVAAFNLFTATSNEKYSLTSTRNFIWRNTSSQKQFKVLYERTARGFISLVTLSYHIGARPYFLKGLKNHICIVPSLWTSSPFERTARSHARAARDLSRAALAWHELKNQKWLDKLLGSPPQTSRCSSYKLFARSPVDLYEVPWVKPAGRWGAGTDQLHTPSRTVGFRGKD